MPNTNLPEDVTAGTPNHPDLHSIVNAEINLMSRDTGWRDLSGLLVNGWTLATGGYLAIRRVDDEVTLVGRSLNGDAATDATFLRVSGTPSEGISSRFAPDIGIGVPTTMSPLYRPGAGSEPWWVYYLNSQWRVGPGVVSTIGTAAFQWTYKTSRALWPTTLPPEA